MLFYKSISYIQKNKINNVNIYPQTCEDTKEERKMKVLLGFLFLKTLELQANLIAYECNTLKRAPTQIDLTQVEKCVKKEEKNITIIEKNIQVVQLKDTVKIEAISCKIIVNHEIKYCGRLFSYTAGIKNGFITEEILLTRTQCEEAILKKEIIYDDDMKIEDIELGKKLKLQEVTRGSIDNNGYCTGQSFNTRYYSFSNSYRISKFEILLMKFEANYMLEEDLIIIEGGERYENVDQGYSEKFGEMFWNRSMVAGCDRKSVDVIYEGKAMLRLSNNKYIGSLVVINSNETAMALKIKGKSAVCFQKAFDTNNRRIKVIEASEHHDFYFKNSDMLIENVDMTSYFEVKIDYLNFKFMNQIRLIYDSLETETCNLRRDLIIRRIRDLRREKVLFEDLITGEIGVQTILAGDVGLVRKCEKISVSLRHTEKCYMNIAVLHEGKECFIDGHTKTVTDEGIEVECGQIYPVTHKINGKFVEFSLINKIVKEPQILNPRWNKLDIASDDTLIKGMYSKNTLEKFRKFVLQRGTKLTLESKYRRAKMNGGGATLSNLFGIEYVNKFKKDFKNEMQLDIIKIGSYVGFIVGIIVIIQIIINMFKWGINFKMIKQTVGNKKGLINSISPTMTILTLIDRNKVIQENVNQE